MLIKVAEIDTFYGHSHVLHGTTFEIDMGQVLGVIGRNGMGKTTLVHTIVGFLTPRAGTIQFKGDELVGLPPERIAARGVALVPQGRRVFGSLTVGENLRVAWRPSSEAGAWTVDEVCDRFPVLKDRWNQYAGLLSGGERQMLAIGRALLRNPELIIMDEPSEGLDPSRVKIVAGIITEFRERGHSVLLVEQKLQFVLDVADSIAVMVRGAIVRRDDVKVHRETPDLIARHLGLA